jgi:PAS domain S-box-containing protein
MFTSPDIEGTVPHVETVDLAAVLKAAQALSESIHLDQLITTLMQVVIENAGAEKGVLLLKDELKDEQLSVVAQRDGNGDCDLTKMSVGDCPHIPATLIHTIERTQETLLLNNATAESTFGTDPYIQSVQPRSLLCLPMIHQGHLVGILYLENNLSVTAFTRDRIEVLNLLMTQAATSLENVRLSERLESYSETLEAKVEERTQALQQEMPDRLLAEEALKASEAELKLMFKAMTDAVVVYDAEGRYLKFVQRQPSLIYTPHINRIGKTVHEILPKEIADPILDAIHQTLFLSQRHTLEGTEGLLQTQQSVLIEYSVPIQGKQIWFSASFSRLSENTVLCVARDVSDRKQAEAALQRSEVNYRNLVQTVNSIIIRFDTEGRIQYLNDYGLRFFGYEESQILGRTLLETIVPETETSGRDLRQLVQNLFEYPELYLQNENENLCRDGRRVWIAWSGKGILNEHGHLVEILSVGIDITQSKRSEEALRQSEATNRALMNAIPDLLIWARADGTYINIVSQGNQKPYAPDRFFPGARVVDSLPPQLADRRLFFIQQALQTGEQQIYEQQLTIDGELQDEEVRIVVTGEDEVLIMVRDITERKRGEIALQQAKLAAEAANRTKSQFLASMSHELRTPLNIILGFTQLLSRDRFSPQQQEYLHTISRSGEHLLELINDVLEMSKIEAGRAALNATSFDLYHQLNTLDDMWQPKALSKELQLTLNRSPDLPQYIKTDESKLRQVLMNLLSNAIKFTQAGWVSLRVWVEAQERLCFAVEDTGDGIAADELKVLFSAFVQTETGRKSQQGTGLGLAISREFVRLMGGDLTLETQVGQGTTFRFDLPLTIATAADHFPLQSDRRVIGLEPDQPCYRLLLVEDRWENRQLLIKLLEPLGFKVRQAVNGQEAIALWDVFEPHLIWMDLQMPVMDGYEATKSIKSQPKGQATVIIALTASAFEEERVVAISAGCDDFVRKPFREAELFEKMAQYLGVRYRYEALVAPPSAEVDRATPLDLLVMPMEWRAQLHQAAMQVDAEKIVKLVEQIPVEHDSLAVAITNLVNQYRFDRLVDLTHSLTQRAE